MCTRSDEKPVASLNARTGSLQSSSLGLEWANHWKRISADSDEQINARGRALPAEDEDDDWADHVRICINFDSKAFGTTTPAKDRAEAPNLGGSNDIDHLYQETMDSKETKDEALDSLWGPVLYRPERKKNYFRRFLNISGELRLEDLSTFAKEKGFAFGSPEIFSILYGFPAKTRVSSSMDPEMLSNLSHMRR
ncbi:hypothetical protein B0H19DRAFT_1081129 [Mycena capillaripes]|nr:hypothetical protein B0H19DRAFT_1081129 [Mycena capillaripes]